MAANGSAPKRSPFQTMVEPCEDCGRETEHHVAIELRTESTKRTNAKYSNEPYRLTECLVCGSRRSLRMNQA